MLATKRLQKESLALAKDPPPGIRAKPAEDNILNFHYVVEGSSDTPYFGGHYHGVLKFPTEYPLKPPSVMMYTPNGRFTTGQRLCMSMSDYHPESWNPVWSVSTILVGLQSFMNQNERTAGSIETTDAQKREYAAASLKWNVDNSKEFRKLFPELVALQEERTKAASSSSSSSSSTAAAAPDASAEAPSAAAEAPGAAVGAAAAAAVPGAGSEAAERRKRNASALRGLLLLIGLVVALVYLSRQPPTSSAASNSSQGEATRRSAGSSSDL